MTCRTTLAALCLSMLLASACGSNDAAVEQEVGAQPGDSSRDAGGDGVADGDNDSDDSDDPAPVPVDAGTGADAGGEDVPSPVDAGSDAGTTDPVVDDPAPKLKRILVFNRVDNQPDTGTVRGHTGGGQDEKLLQQLGEEHNFEVVITDKGADFTPENLARFEVVVFASPHYIAQELSNANRDALEAFIRKGGGWVGWHYALKVEVTWPFLKTLGGGVTLGGHVGGEQASKYTLVNQNHPVTQGLTKDFDVFDDYIAIKGDIRANSKVTLLGTAALNAAPLGNDNPTMWAHEIDKGRVFYSMPGHNAADFTAAWSKPLIWNALRWASHTDK